MQTGLRVAGVEAAFLVMLAACAGPGPSGEVPARPSDPGTSQPSGHASMSVGESPSANGRVAELRGARLVVDVPDAVAAGQSVTFKVRLENSRAEPLQYEWNSCFVYVDIRVPLPTEPIGRSDWTGRAGEFKAFALANAMQGGGAPATDPTSIMPISTDCEGSDGLTEPLPPGHSIEATFVWKSVFNVDLPIPPRSATFSVTAPIFQGHGDVTPPPPPTAFPAGHWFPQMDQLVVNGAIEITGNAKPMAGIGEVIDGALADPQFIAFVRSEPFERCALNVYLTDNEGTYLPRGPGWDVEVLCDDPRHFIRVKVDPWTASVLGVDRCTDPCSR